MPARELRDQLQTEAVAPSSTEALAPMGALQLPLTAQQQRVAVQVVLTDFRAAEAARKERNYGINAKGDTLDFDKWLKELTDLYFGRRIPKTIPWRFCSNRSLMIAMAILEVSVARIFPAVWSEDLTDWRPGTRVDADKADRIDKLMAWWTRVRSELREFFERWVRTTIAFGQSLTETQWEVLLLDQGLQQPHQPILDEAGQPVQNPDGTPALVQGVRKPPVPFERTRSDIIPWADVFLAPGATDIQKDPVVIRKHYLYRDLEALERQGIAINVSHPTAPGIRTLKDLLQPAEVAGTEGVSPQEVEELRNVARRNLPVTCLVAYNAVDFDGDEFSEPVRLLIAQDQQLYLGGIALHDLSAKGIRHLDVTQFYPRLDEPQSVWGLGVLEQVKELALEIDALFNQMTDANSMNVLRPIFYDPSGDLDAGALKLEPLKAIAVPNPSQNVFLPSFDIATERLMNAVRLVGEFIERLTGASDYIMGRESNIVGGSGTATRTEAIVGASNQRNSIPVQRLREGAARIMTHHLDLIQKNIPPGLEERILGSDGEPIFLPNELSAEGIAGEFTAYLLPDESYGSKQTERQLAQAIYTVGLANPLIATDMTKVYKVTSDLFKAYGKDPVIYLGPEPPASLSNTPEDEHTLMLQGDFGAIRVNTAQNQLEHLMAHQAFPNDPAFQALPPLLQQQLVQFLQIHTQQHQQLLQNMMVMQAQMMTAGGRSHAPGVGSAGGGGSPAAPVGPESGVGDLQHPRTQAQVSQRGGESRGPAA